MKKSVAIVCVVISVLCTAITPAFSEVICVEETVLEQIISEEVDKAIDEAISIVIKEKDLKYNNLHTQYRLAVVDNERKTATITQLKKDLFWKVLKTSLLVGLSSLAVGTVTGVVVAR